ncbi:MAG: lipoate--protein ligase family protein [Promethearchaeota archaeon]
MNNAKWRFLPTRINDGPTNMAIDEAILVSRMKNLVPNTVRLYQWSPSTVTIGRHQSVSLEVDLQEIKKRGFQLVRRISGGGAVLHAENLEITYSIVARINEIFANLPEKNPTLENVYKIIIKVIQRTLQKLSLESAQGVIHCPALLLSGKKISGNAQCIKGNTVLQHGTILLKVEPEVMYSVLKPPAGVTKSRMVRSVKAKVIGLEEFLGKKVDIKDFEMKYMKSFSEVVRAPLSRGNLTRYEVELVRKLKEKYDSDAWRMKYP